MKQLKRVRRVFLAVGFLLVSFWAVLFIVGRLPDTLEADGVIEARKVHPVSTSVTGILKRIYVEEGDRVAEGEVVAEFERRSFSEKARGAELEVDRLELEIEKVDSEISALVRLKGIQHTLLVARSNIAEARLEQSRDVLERKKKGIDDDIIPLAELEQAETDFTVAKENLELEAAEEKLKEQELEEKIARRKVERSQILVEFDQALLGLEKAKADLEACMFTAPVSGTVMQVASCPGDLLERGIRLTTIVCDRDMRFTAFVSDEDMARMQSNLTAEISMDAFPHRKYGIFHGRVEAVAPGSDPLGERSFFRVTVALENLGKAVLSGEEARTAYLKPGQRGKARIIVSDAVPVWDLLYEKSSDQLLP